MLKLLLIAGGSALGGVLRHLVGGALQRSSDVDFPIGTLVVNVLGCLAIGALAALFAGPLLIREEYRFALVVGLLGGFTTFSSFGLETFQLAAAGQLVRAVLNVVVSCVLGLAAVWIGYRIVERWIGVA
jgi:CrcB protein